MSDFSTWFKSIPYFTRHWLALTIGFSLLGRFGFVSGYHFYLLYEHTLKQWQLWRPVTALFFYPITRETGFHFLINCYFLLQYSSKLEVGHFLGYPADYLHLLVFNWLCCVGTALIVGFPVLMDPMVLSVLYIWCQLNRDVQVFFWFGSKFKAMYLPWVLLAFNVIIAGGGLMELVGIVVGHLYFFLKFKYPQEMGGPTLLSTPSIFRKWFPDERGGTYGFGQPAGFSRQEPAAGGAARQRHSWGQGYTLGSS